MYARNSEHHLMGFGFFFKKQKQKQKQTRNNPMPESCRSLQLWIPKIMSGRENVKKKRYHYLEPPSGLDGEIKQKLAIKVSIIQEVNANMFPLLAQFTPTAT
jgi:hypothetical protein